MFSLGITRLAVVVTLRPLGRSNCAARSMPVETEYDSICSGPTVCCTAGSPIVHLQDPTVFWDAATLVDAFNKNEDPNDTLADSGQSFTDYYLLSSGLCILSVAPCCLQLVICLCHGLTEGFTGYAALKL
jgi:hypothetical protein